MKIITGDLVKMAKDGEFDMIFHGCNCFHTMGGGIARQIRLEFPEAYSADCNTAYGAIDKLGTMSSAKCGSTTVVNCYTQWEFGTDKKNFVDSSLLLVLDKLALLLKELSHHDDFVRRRLGFPLIGAGLGGGDPVIVTEMLEAFADKVQKYADVTLVLFDPNA